MTANEDLIFDPERALATLFNNDGLSTLTTYTDNEFLNTYGHDLVFRKLRTRGDEEALQAIVRHDACEVNMLRMLGLPVINHISFVVPGRLARNPGMYYQEPIIVTGVEKLFAPDLQYTFAPDRDVVMRDRILQAFQTYYTHEPERPHKIDINTPSRYSRQGLLVNMEMDMTQPPGSTFDSCEYQLNMMYLNFRLSTQQIEDLTRDYSYFPKDTQPKPV
jgi:hypothetical protein